MVCKVFFGGKTKNVGFTKKKKGVFNTLQDSPTQNPGGGIPPKRKTSWWGGAKGDRGQREEIKKKRKKTYGGNK